MAKYYEKQSKSQNAASLASTHLAFHNNLLSIKSVMESFPLRFFHHPLPALHQPSSRLACPCRRRVGFSVFRINNGGGLGPVYSPMAKCPRDLTLKQINQPCTFWFKPVSTFGLFLRNEVYRQFTYVDHTTKPSSLPRCARRCISPSRD